MNIRPSAAAIVVAAALPLSQPVYATTDTVADEVIVTATRVPRSLASTNASVTVLTRDDIDRSQARTVDEVLRGLPGLSIANNGGFGKTTSFFLRGTESDHVLVLVDGVRIGSASLGTATLQDLPLSRIDRIEVIRGPRSGLYGSEAIGGVIQIFTKRGGGELSPSAYAGYGSDRTRQAGVALSGGGENSWFNVGLSYLNTDGFDSCAGSFSNGCFTVEPDSDGYRNLGANVRAGTRLGENAEVDFTWLRAESENEFDGSFQNESDGVQDVLGLRLSASLSDSWNAQVAVGRNKDETTNFKDGVRANRFDSTRDSFTFQNDFQVVDNHLIVLGYDYLEDKLSSSEAFAKNSRDNHGVFAQYLASLGRHEVQLAARTDDNEQFGRHNTGSVSWGYAFSPALRGFVAYGTAFKAPSFNELYFPFFGNPDLDPEEARSLELGLVGETRIGSWSINAYETRIDDLISYDASIFAPNNIDRTRIRGLEGTVQTRIAEWIVSATATLMDPENRSDGPTRGNVLPRRAEQSARVDVDRGFGALSVGATLRAEGRRYDDLRNDVRLHGYGTLDMRAEYALARDWRVQLRVDNVLDKDYETAAYYNQQGLAAFVTLRYQPGR